MVCGVCGNRNLIDATRCARCGARLQHPAPEPGPVSEREYTPAERLALEARERLAAGDVAGGLDLARRAAVMETDVVLPRLALGEAHLQAGDAEAALRYFRSALDLDPSCAEAREKAEAARRALTQRREAGPELPATWLGFVVRHKQWVAAGLGAFVGILVFAAGAVALVVRSSPDYQLRKQYEQQMSLAGEAYRAGRYEEAARAFGEACRLKPDSAEAQRRYQDALAMAGYPAVPAQPYGGAVGERVASVSPANPYPPMAPVWVGPRPTAAQPGYPTPSTSPPIPPPPPDEPLPPPTRDNTPLPPPVPAAPPVEPGTGPPAVSTPLPDTGIGAEAEPEAPVAPPPRTKTGRIVIQRHEAPPRTTLPAPAPPSGAALRAEAERLHRSGQTAQAARVYGQAEAQLRAEAAAGGPDAAAKLSAAASCAWAKALCESRDN